MFDPALQPSYGGGSNVDSQHIFSLGNYENPQDSTFPVDFEHGTNLEGSLLSLRRLMAHLYMSRLEQMKQK